MVGKADPKNGLYVLHDSLWTSAVIDMLSRLARYNHRPDYNHQRIEGIYTCDVLTYLQLRRWIRRSRYERSICTPAIA